MYELSYALLGFCFGLMVKVAFFLSSKRSNVQTGVDDLTQIAFDHKGHCITPPTKTITLPLSRGKVDWNALPKPSNANRPHRIK